MLKAIKRLIERLLPSFSAQQWRMIWEGYERNQTLAPRAGSTPSPAPSNPLREYFDSYKEGRGIWKWNHYFDVYHRHFSKFRDREVHLLEIGIYSGGSLEMWKHYFGSRCHVYGVDIEPACKTYESDSVTVFVGDQADRAFWRRVKGQIPALDIVIDDGGHQAQQQIVTLEELLPQVRDGGVYLCEDIHGAFAGFGSYMSGFIHNLNQSDPSVNNEQDNERRIVCKATPFQSLIGSVHFYPFVTVIEKREGPVAEFVSPKRGTQWQPFMR